MGGFGVRFLRFFLFDVVELCGGGPDGLLVASVAPGKISESSILELCRLVQLYMHSRIETYVTI